VKTLCFVSDDDYGNQAKDLWARLEIAAPRDFPYGVSVPATKSPSVFCVCARSCSST
jgi:hypothetical protein